MPRPLRSAEAWCRGAAAWLATCPAVEVPRPRSGCPGALMIPVAARTSDAAAVRSGGPSPRAASVSAAKLHAAWSQAWMVACRSVLAAVGC